jgi:hypothetical protein
VLDWAYGEIIATQRFVLQSQCLPTHTILAAQGQTIDAQTL